MECEENRFTFTAKAMPAVAIAQAAIIAMPVQVRSTAGDEKQSLPDQAAWNVQSTPGRMLAIRIANAVRKITVARARIVLIDTLSTRLPATVASVLALDPIHEPVIPAPAPTAATSPRIQSWMLWAYRTMAARRAQPTV